MQMSEQYTVRLCKAADALTLAPLVRALSIEEGYAHPPEREPLAKMIDTLLRNSLSDFLLAERHGAPVGCLQMNYRFSTWTVGSYAYIEDLYLVPEARSLGIGTVMIERACQHARARGCAYIELDVRSENHAAQRLYARLGFQQHANELWRRSLATDSN